MKSKITITYEGNYEFETQEDICSVGGANNHHVNSFTSNKRYKLTLPNNLKVDVQIESLESSMLKDNLSYKNVELKIDNKKQIERITEELMKSIKDGMARMQ